MGFSSSRSLNALEAVKAALREKPQLILINSRLPFIDGLEATRRIRENRHLDQVKILALNGSGSPRYHAEALAAGCNDSIENYLTSKGSELTWPALSSTRRLSGIICSCAYAGFRFCLKRLSARTTTAATSNR